ncbi:uncharacterized protein LOC114537197 [Dendronephthya gigantea]|nr:uncharacterized protein LOC114537197 [Dendronephthya gigantea]
MDKKHVKQKVIQTTLSIKEQFVMTLVRLKRSPTLLMLANNFGISESTCSRIVTTWVLFLEKELQFLLPFSTLTEMEGLQRPKVFRPYPNLRAVIDCTEFYIEKPSNPSSQRRTYSGYKSANTFKLLVSLSPICHFNFVSELYSGSISDKSIVQRSGFLNALEANDVVMADKGFNIQDILALHHVYLLAPPIMAKNKISEQAVTLTRRIARARVHVERMIRKLKLFRILRSPIPLTIKPYINSIAKVCAYLVNLQPSIIKDTD